MSGLNIPGSILSLIPNPPLTGTTGVPTETSTPVPAASSSQSHRGAIAGGVIGGVVLLCILISAALYYRFKRRAPYQSRRGREETILPHSVPKSAEYFNGTDTLVGEEVLKTKRSASYSSRIGKYDSSTSIGHGRSSLGYSQEDGSYIGHDDRTQASFQYGRRSKDSVEDIPPVPLEYPPALPIPTYTDGRTRSRSITDHSRAAALAALDGGAAPASWAQYPPSPHTPTRRSADARPSSMSLSRSDSRGNRSSNGIGRRATRKAVPKYDATEFSNPASPTSPGYPPLSPVAMQDSRDDVGHHSGSADTSSSSVNVSAMKSREDLMAAGYEVPDLNHKSSFGNKPMHYLIPDPPPPQRD
ncbi:hypothetical protein BDW22DRAFT_291589 [Trametopsis cervina]|nr:hypothetical protein BDW22DRAFT_291589 [Trametopsis cervina]